jgi:hypothetical protein
VLAAGVVGVTVIGYAFVRMSQSFAKAKQIDAEREAKERADERSLVPTPADPKPPTTEPNKSPVIKTKPKTDPPKSPDPKPRDLNPLRPEAKSPRTTSNAASPVGMPGLVHAISFDETTIRDFITRTTLPADGVVTSRPGMLKNAATLIARQNPDDESTFALDASKLVRSFQRNDDQAFAIAIWVRAIAAKPIPVFTLMQSTTEASPRLEILADTKEVRVEFACDPADSDKAFVRSTPVARFGPTMNHVAVARSTAGALSVFVNGVRLEGVPADSLPEKQPVDLRFKHAGFGRRDARTSGSITLDEFALFHRELTAAEIAKLAGTGK